ncbi:MAG TPA: DUF3090 family protein [Acidimicrobiia bacterium]
MAVDELGPAERFAAGAIGRPGSRRFYLEVTTGGAVHTFPCEKNQVAALAVQGLQLLTIAGIEPDDDAVDRLLGDGLEISEPEAPRFRIGSIGLAVNPSEFLLITLGSEDEGESASFVVSPEQFRAMAIAAARVVAAGRPICPRCQLPEDPDGHFCPSVNGHQLP